MIQGNKNDFPLLCQQDIVYLDTGATAQRPYTVLDAEREYYEKYNANPLRGLYDLGMLATEHYEMAREKVRKFINAKSDKEIIFTRNTSEGINLVAYSYGLNFIKEEDEIVVAIGEHHSNLLPWQMVAKQTGATLKYLECTQDGLYTMESIKETVTEKTKLVAMNHISNVIGRINPVKELAELVHANGGVMIVDGAQSTPHIPVDVQDLDCDFLAFSGHKLMGPMGIGVLYGKEELLDQMPPFLSGGEMIDSVTRDGAVYAELPHKFEAGTVNGGGAAGIAAAIDYINEVGYEKIHEVETRLTRLCFSEMKKIEGVHIIGSDNPDEHNGILSFTIEGVHPHDISAILNEDHIAIRAGHHCAQPLLTHLGISSSVRASIYFYNTEEDIMRFIESLKLIRGKMGYGR